MPPHASILTTYYSVMFTEFAMELYGELCITYLILCEGRVSNSDVRRILLLVTPFFFLSASQHIAVLYSQPFGGLLASSFEVSRSHKTTLHSRYDSSGQVISSSQRPLPDNTQHSQQTNVHAPSGIRTHNVSWRAAVDLRLRPLGYWDRHWLHLLC